jgi:hypothetical protein
MRLFFVLAVLAAPVSLALVPEAHAAGKSDAKAAAAALTEEAKAMYPGTVWALKDLPVNTGTTMNIPWIGPLVEVAPDGFKIETTTVIQATYGGAKSVWFGVRANDTLSLKEATLDKDVMALTFVGIDGSKGRDTKIKITGVKSLAEVKPVLDQLLSNTSPVDPSWPEDVKKAIAKRQVINGMTKKQAYLVVGEPESANTQDVGGGKKVETWVPRQSNGVRIGFGASLEMSNYPKYLTFEEGKVTNMAAAGGVSLE